MATQTFDELNILKQKSIPFEEYFGEMDLEEEEKERRIKLANELDDMFFYLLAMFDEEDYDIENIKSTMTSKYVDIVSRFYKDDIKPDDNIYRYIEDISSEIADTTKKNLSDVWYTSQDRATYLAENETNSIANHYQERQAIAEGKKNKMWRTILDGKERHTHLLAHNQTVPILEAFTVGQSKMAYPRDTSLGANAKEIVNCRCSCFYF